MLFSSRILLSQWIMVDKDKRETESSQPCWFFFSLFSFLPFA